MSNYLADISWSTIAKNVSQHYEASVFTLNTYDVDVYPLDVNEPGGGSLECAVGDYFIDYLGWPWLIQRISILSLGKRIELYDVNERSVDQYVNYGPYGNQIGYVYRPTKDGIILSQAQLLKLSPQARDRINNIEKGVIWENLGGDSIEEGFKPIVFYDFNSDTTGDWTRKNCTLSSPNDSITRYAATTADPSITRALTIDGGENQLIKIRYKLIAGTNLSGSIFYSTSGHGEDTNYRINLELLDNSEWNILELDMSDLYLGGTDWVDNAIISVRFDLGSSDDIIIDIDWIGIGKVGWGTQLFEDRVDVLKHIGSAVETVVLNVGGTTAPGGFLQPILQIGHDGDYGNVRFLSTSAPDSSFLSNLKIYTSYGDGLYSLGLSQNENGEVGIKGLYSAGTALKIHGDAEITTSGLKINGLSYAWPNAHNLNDYVLTNDGNGNLSWSNKSGGTTGTITSINGSSESAQTIVGGTGITVTESGAGNQTHTITSTALPTHAARNNEPNKLVRTQVNGYCDFGWINTTSGVAAGTPLRIYCSQDEYIRYYSPSQLAPYILNQGSTKNAHTHSEYYLDSNPDNYTSNVGDIVGVTAGNGLTGGATTGTATVTMGMPSDSGYGSSNTVSSTSHTHKITGFQPLDAALTSLAGTGSYPGVGLVKRTGTDAYTVDTSVYLTSVTQVQVIPDGYTTISTSWNLTTDENVYRLLTGTSTTTLSSVVDGSSGIYIIDVATSAKLLTLIHGGYTSWYVDDNAPTTGTARQLLLPVGRNILTFTARGSSGSGQMQVNYAHYKTFI